MGLFGGIKNFLFGKQGGGLPGQSWDEKQYGKGAAYALGNRAGATFSSTDSSGNPQYDYSKSFAPVSKAQATAGYDFSPFTDAIKGFRKPTQFNFQGLPDKYAADQYALGAKDIRREGAGQLQGLKNSIGIRNPALLFKAGKDSQRGVMENLAQLNTSLRGNAMLKNTDLAVDQQKAQADENAGAYQNLADISGKRIALQSDITDREREYQDKALAYLLDVYKTLNGNRLGVGREQGSKGSIGDLASIASAFI